jgi:hypothetical protein
MMDMYRYTWLIDRIRMDTVSGYLLDILKGYERITLQISWLEIFMDTLG